MKDYPIDALLPYGCRATSNAETRSLPRQAVLSTVFFTYECLLFVCRRDKMTGEKQ